MATLIAEFPVVGRLGDYSAYRVKGSGKIIVRRKGGATKEKIQKDPAFELTRRQNSEFSGRARCYSLIRRALFPLRMLMDGGAGGRLNKLLKHIQDMDTTSPYGQRMVCVSRHARWLNGFALNTNHPFDSMITSPIRFSIFREEGRAEMVLPEMARGINFFPPEQYPYYRLILVLGVVPDMLWGAGRYDVGHTAYEQIDSAAIYTAWTSIGSLVPEVPISLKMPAIPPDERHALLLGIGVQFATAVEGGAIREVKYGAAKILGAGGSEG